MALQLVVTDCPANRLDGETETLCALAPSAATERVR
jgi:hypothetical protein